MRILMLNPFFHPYLGGTEKHVFEVARRLKGHEVTVLTARLAGTRKEEELQGVRIVRSDAWVLNDLPKPLPPPVPIMPRHGEDLKRLARKTDVVHGHNRFFYGLEPASVAHRFKKRLAWTVHNARPEGVDLATDFWGQAFDETVGKTLFSQCDAVLGVSRHALETALPKGYSGIRQVAYNGVDHHLFHPHHGEVRDAWGLERMVLCVARFVPQKGLEYLIDAMQGLDATLVLVGRGPEEKELKKRARKKSVRAFFVTQEIGEKTLSDYYAACDVFALPSIIEPFGVVLAEAMASGKPVVASHVGGIPEIVTSGKEGFLVPAKNPGALRSKIRFLLDNPKKAKSMGEAGRKLALTKFTWDQTAQAYGKVYAALE